MLSLQSHYYRFFVGRMFDWSQPVPELRQKMESWARWTMTARGVAVTPIPDGNIKGEWLRPAGSVDDRAILYLHGGGYFMGSCNTHRSTVSRIAKAGRINALSLEYRLAPEHPFPAALEDAVAAYKWLLNEGFQPYNIAVVGDSAGGGLAIATLLSLRDEGVPLPRVGVCISPWADLKGTGESLSTRAELDPFFDSQMIDASALYAGENDLGSPLISPVYADLTGLPPLLIHVGTDEILLSDSTRLAQNAKSAQVDVTLKIWERMWHNFHTLAPFMPEANKAIGEIGTFLDRQLGGVATDSSKASLGF